MAITEQDVLDNAPQIAQLINGSPADVDLNALPEETSWANTDLAHIQKSGVDSKIKKSNLGLGGGGGSLEPNPQYPAGSIDYPATNPAPLNTRTLTNGTQKEQLHDDTTDETVIETFNVPSDIDTAGTVTFIHTGSPVTAVASKNVSFDFLHSAVAVGSNIDVAYTTEASGDKVLSATQDALNRLTWTETVANLGWTASMICRWKLNRHNAGVTNNVAGDYGTWSLEIDIPRA